MQGDLYDPRCPTRLVLDRIADKWTVMLLVTLAAAPTRFATLRRCRGRRLTARVPGSVSNDCSRTRSSVLRALDSA